MAYASMFRGYGPLAPVDGLGETLTAAQELRRYREYLIAYKAALAAAQTDAQRAYAATLLAQANQYKAAYLGRGASDLTAVDRAVLAVSDAVTGTGKALDKTIDWAGDKANDLARKAVSPLLPVLAVAALGLVLYMRKGR